MLRDGVGHSMPKNAYKLGAHGVEPRGGLCEVLRQARHDTVSVAEILAIKTLDEQPASAEMKLDHLFG